MWTKSHSVVTRAATRQQIWNLFADADDWAGWDAGLEYTKLHGKFEKGGRIELKPAGGPKVMITLLEVEPLRRFLDVTPFPLAKMYDDHTFEETADGLRITHTITVKGPLSFLWVKLVASKLAASLPQDMANQIKEAAARY
jgi:Polyketide cyclase / dehydrase and lipid transport